MSTQGKWERHIQRARKAFGLMIIEEAEGAGDFSGLLTDNGYCIFHGTSAEVLIFMARASRRRKRAAIRAVNSYCEARQEREPRWEGGAEEHSYRML